MIHEAPLEAVQLHAAGAATSTLPIPPFAPKLKSAGEIAPNAAVLRLPYVRIIRVRWPALSLICRVAVTLPELRSIGFARSIAAVPPLLKAIPLARLAPAGIEPTDLSNTNDNVEASNPLSRSYAPTTKRDMTPPDAACVVEGKIARWVDIGAPIELKGVSGRGDFAGFLEDDL